MRTDWLTRRRHGAKGCSGGRLSNRSGVVLLLAIVCLGTVSVVTVLSLKQAAGDRRRMQSAAHRLQAIWLLEAGADRAAAQWAARADYAGETWNLPAVELDGTGPAQVTIVLDPPAVGEGHRRMARIAAEFPASGARPVRLEKHAIITRSETRP